MADFESTNEITVLNPEAFEGHRPMLKPEGIKHEPKDLSQSEGSEEAHHEDLSFIDENQEFMPPMPPPTPTTNQPGPSGRPKTTKTKKKTKARDVVVQLFDPTRRSKRGKGGDDSPRTFSEEAEMLKLAEGKGQRKTKPSE